MRKKQQTWSIAQGIKQGIFFFSSGNNLCGNELEKDGAACTEGKIIFAVEASPVKPKVELA